MLTTTAATAHSRLRKRRLSSSSTKKFYCLKPFRHTLDDYLQEFVTTRQAKQATKWNIVSYSWLQRHDQLLPLAHSRRFWHDRHIVIDPPPPPAHDQCIREYFNACYTQLQHQVTFASSQQPFESDFTRALLKHDIGNPQTTDDSKKRDDTFWPSIQEEIQYMMLHTSRERYNNDYEPVLLTRSQAYVETSSDAVVLHPIIPYDLSKISIVEFSNCVCFVKRDTPLQRKEFKDFADFRVWLRLLNHAYIEIEHSFPSQKHYLNKDYISPHFQHYEFRFYGFEPELCIQLATYLQLLPLQDKPWCRMDYYIRFYRPYTSWKCMPTLEQGCCCCVDLDAWGNYTVDDIDAQYFVRECLELVLPFRTLQVKQPPPFAAAAANKRKQPRADTANKQ
eukprot:gene1455-1606_t